MKKTLCRILSLVLILIIAVPLHAYAADTDRSASIYEYEGTVKVAKSGGEKEYSAFEGMSLTEGDRISTGYDSWAILQIDDDKEIKVGENTIMTISQMRGSIEAQNDQTGVGLVVGKIFTSIKKKLHIRSKFEVKTTTTVMGVRGTKFFIAHKKGKTNIAVVDGTVAATSYRTVTRPDGVPEQRTIETVLTQNQQTTLDENIQSNEDVKVEEVTNKTLDVMALEEIKRDPDKVDPKLLENIDEVIEEKKEEEQKQQKQTTTQSTPVPVISFDPNVGGGDNDKPAGSIVSGAVTSGSQTSTPAPTVTPSATATPATTPTPVTATPMPVSITKAEWSDPIYSLMLKQSEIDGMDANRKVRIENGLYMFTKSSDTSVKSSFINSTKLGELVNNIPGYVAEVPGEDNVIIRSKSPDDFKAIYVKDSPQIKISSSAPYGEVIIPCISDIPDFSSIIIPMNNGKFLSLQKNSIIDPNMPTSPGMSIIYFGSAAKLIELIPTKTSGEWSAAPLGTDDVKLTRNAALSETSMKTIVISMHYDFGGMNNSEEVEIKNISRLSDNAEVLFYNDTPVFTKIMSGSTAVFPGEFKDSTEFINLINNLGSCSAETDATKGDIKVQWNRPYSEPGDSSIEIFATYGAEAGNYGHYKTTVAGDVYDMQQGTVINILGNWGSSIRFTKGVDFSMTDIDGLSSREQLRNLINSNSSSSGCKWLTDIKLTSSNGDRTVRIYSPNLTIEDTDGLGSFVVANVDDLPINTEITIKNDEFSSYPLKKVSQITDASTQFTNVSDLLTLIKQYTGGKWNAELLSDSSDDVLLKWLKDVEGDCGIGKKITIDATYTTESGSFTIKEFENLPDEAFIELSTDSSAKIGIEKISVITADNFIKTIAQNWSQFWSAQEEESSFSIGWSRQGAGGKGGNIEVIDQIYKPASVIGGAEGVFRIDFSKAVESGTSNKMRVIFESSKTLEVTDSFEWLNGNKTLMIGLSNLPDITGKQTILCIEFLAENGQWVKLKGTDGADVDFASSKAIWYFSSPV